MAHPGDWFLPKIHTPETGLRSILGWLHNKIKIKSNKNRKRKKRKKKSNQIVSIVCLHQEEFGFCTWLVSPLLLKMVCPASTLHTETCPDQH